LTREENKEIREAAVEAWRSSKAALEEARQQEMHQQEIRLQEARLQEARQQEIRLKEEEEMRLQETRLQEARLKEDAAVAQLKTKLEEATINKKKVKEQIWAPAEKAARLRLARLESQLQGLTQMERVGELQAEKMRLSNLLAQILNLSKLEQNKDYADAVFKEVIKNDSVVNVAKSLFEAHSKSLHPFLNKKKQGPGAQNLFDLRYLFDYTESGSVDELLKKAPYVKKEEFIERTALELYLSSLNLELDDVSLQTIRKCYRDPACTSEPLLIKKIKGALSDRQRSWFADANYLADAIYQDESVLPVAYMGQTESGATDIGTRFNRLLDTMKLDDNRAQFLASLGWASLHGLKYTGGAVKAVGSAIIASNPAQLLNLVPTIIEIGSNVAELALLKEVLFTSAGTFSEEADKLLTTDDKKKTVSEQLSLVLSRIKLAGSTAAIAVSIGKSIPIVVNLLSAAASGSKTMAGLGLMAGGYIVETGASKGISAMESEFVQSIMKEGLTDADASKLVKANYSRLSGLSNIYERFVWAGTKSMALDEATFNRLLEGSKGDLQRRFRLHKEKFTGEDAWIAQLPDNSWWLDNEVKHHPGSIDFILQMILVDTPVSGGGRDIYDKYLRRLVFILFITNLNFYEFSSDDAIFRTILFNDANYILLRSFISYVVARANDSVNNDKLYVQLPFRTLGFYGNFLFRDEKIVLKQRGTVLAIENLLPLAPSVEPLAPSVEPLAPSVEPLAPSVEPLAPSVKPLAPSIKAKLPVLTKAEQLQIFVNNTLPEYNKKLKQCKEIQAKFKSSAFRIFTTDPSKPCFEAIGPRPVFQGGLRKTLKNKSKRKHKAKGPIALA